MKKTNIIRVSTRALVGFFTIYFSNGVMAASPCTDSQYCRQLSATEAMNLSWEPGTREFIQTALSPVSFEAKLHCVDCFTYHTFPERCSKDSRANVLSPFDVNAKTTDGLVLRNKQSKQAVTKLLFRETYILKAGDNGAVSLGLAKEILNGQNPVGMKFAFRMVPKLSKNCYDDDQGPFEAVDFLYDTSQLSGLKGVEKALNRSIYKVVALGDSTSGFLKPLNSSEVVAGRVKEGLDFSYYLVSLLETNSRQVLSGGNKGEVNFWKTTSDSANRGEVWDGQTLGSLFKSEAKAFLDARLVPAQPEYWFSAIEQKMFLVFPGEEAQPIVFPLAKINRTMSRDGDQVFFEDPLLTSLVVLGKLESLKSSMRPSIYRRTYGVLEDSVNEVRAILTTKTASGHPMTQSMGPVRNKMRVAYYTQHIILAQRFAMDTARGLKREKTVTEISQQLDHMFREHGFSRVNSGAPMYAIYGGYISDTIDEMRIPDLMKKIPNSLSSVNVALAQVFNKANALRIRKELSDANIKTGLIVDELLNIYDTFLVPELEKTIKEGMNWSGYDQKLMGYIESIRGIRTIDNDMKDSAPANGNGPTPVGDLLKDPNQGILAPFPTPSHN